MSMPQSQSLVMNEELRRAISTEVAREQEDTDWNSRDFVAASGQQQHDQAGYQRQNLPNEPSTIALLQQKFAQLERHKVEMQKANQAQQVQLYPSQWPMTSQPPHSLLQSQGAPTTFAESRHYSSSNASCYPLQQQQHQHVFPAVIPDVSEHNFAPKQDLSWRPTQPALTPGPPPNRTKSTPTAWTVGSSPQNGDAASNNFMFFKHQSQHQQPKVGDYRQNVRLRDVGAHQRGSGSFHSSASVVPDLGHLSSLVASSRGDKTGSNSVKIKSAPEQYSSDSEMSLDNFSGRVSTHVSQAPGPTVPHTAQVAICFHMFIISVLNIPEMLRFCTCGSLVTD